MAKLNTFQDVVHSFKDNSDNALTWPDGSMSYNDLYDAINSLSKKLLTAFKPGDHISLRSENSPEILIADLAIKNSGMVTVWHSDKAEEAVADEVQKNIAHSNSRALIVDDESMLKHLDTKGLEVFSIKPVQGIRSLDDLASSDADLPRFDDSISTLIYTSGTTGDPKGVMLSHKNIISNILTVRKRVIFTEDDLLLAFLPWSHTFGSIAIYTSLSSGANNYLSSIRSLPDDMKQQHPTIVATVPAVWEKAYKRIVKNAREHAEKKGVIAKYALKHFIDWSTNKDSRGSLDPRKLAGEGARSYLEKELYPKIRENFGNKLRYIVSGGASLPPYIEDFFDAAGLEILVGWGLTETSPVLSGRIAGKKARYTAGPLLEGIEGRVIKDGKIVQEYIDGNLSIHSSVKEGELLVRTPGLMQGYYKNPEATNRVIHDGWFSTGDIGYFDKDANVVITGRDKDIIKLLNGQMIHPESMEVVLATSEYIECAIVTGLQKHLGVIIVPNMENVKEYLERKHIDFDSAMKNPNIVPELKSLYRVELYDLVNNSPSFSRDQRLRHFRIINHQLTVGDKELTSSNKVRRFLIEEHYKPLIDDMKAEDK